MKQKLIYPFRVRAWIAALALAVISLIASLTDVLQMTFTSPAYIFDYFINCIFMYVCPLLFTVMLFIIKRSRKAASILLLLLLGIYVCVNILAVPYTYQVKRLLLLAALVFQIIAIIRIIRGQRAELFFIGCTIALALFHAINIYQTHKLYYSWDYVSNMTSSITWCISDVALFAGLCLFCVFNALPPLVSVSPQQALKHLSIAKKKGNISEEEYNAQRTKILSSI